MNIDKDNLASVMTELTEAFASPLDSDSQTVVVRLNRENVLGVFGVLEKLATALSEEVPPNARSGVHVTTHGDRAEAKCESRHLGPPTPILDRPEYRENNDGPVPIPETFVSDITAALGFIDEATQEPIYVAPRRLIEEVLELRQWCDKTITDREAHLFEQLEAHKAACAEIVELTHSYHVIAITEGDQWTWRTCGHEDCQKARALMAEAAGVKL